jgi:hypothetical protein
MDRHGAQLAIIAAACATPPPSGVREPDTSHVQHDVRLERFPVIVLSPHRHVVVRV